MTANVEIYCDRCSKQIHAADEESVFIPLAGDKVACVTITAFPEDIQEALVSTDPEERIDSNDLEIEDLEPNGQHFCPSCLLKKLNYASGFPARGLRLVFPGAQPPGTGTADAESTESYLDDKAGGPDTDDDGEAGEDLEDGEDGDQDSDLDE